MAKFDPYKAKIALTSLNSIRVWPKGIHGYVKRARTTLKKIVRSSLFENSMTLCVTLNTVTLAIDRPDLDKATNDLLGAFNMFFTIVFIVEMAARLLAFGVTKYLADKMNYLDGSVVILSIVEMAFMSGGGALSAFRTVRIFRTFRVLRVARLLRAMKSMMYIIMVISRSISSFIYLAMLLLLFIFIYALLGMQIFGNKFNFDDGKPRTNFDSFNHAFVTAFIILSMENWQAIFYQAMRTDVSMAIVTLYFISWIFIGNFMLLNLFLAILLDSFTQVEEEDHETPEKIAAREKKRLEDLQKREGEDLINEIQSIAGEEQTGAGGGGGKAKGGGGLSKKKKKKKDGGNDILLDDSYDMGD